MINFNLIQPQLFVGTYPQGPVDVERLNAMGITAVLNLQTDEDFARLGLDWARLQQAYADVDLVLQRHPMRDFDPEDQGSRLAGAVDILARLLSVQHRVYLHCTAGIGRAPAVAIGYLAWHQGWQLDQAYDYVRQQRDCNPYLDAIRAAESKRARRNTQ